MEFVIGCMFFLNLSSDGPGGPVAPVEPCAPCAPWSPCGPVIPGFVFIAPPEPVGP